MKNKLLFGSLLLVAFIFVLYLFFPSGISRTSEEIPDSLQTELLFANEVYPLLKAKCFACHGDDPSEIEGGFDIRTLESLMKGGESGLAALVPGHPDKSAIYEAITWENPDLEMPPKENDRLTDTEVNLVKKWILGGALWPDEAQRMALMENHEWKHSGGIKVATSGALSAEWANRRYKEEDLWAFKPLKKVEVPVAFLREKEVNPIDAFIIRKLDSLNIEKTQKADQLTLIRRAAFDLTGLPPTPAEIDLFLNDKSQKAYENLIERLLDSPRYGERWGRHWLDVVRYADSDGYSNDFERPNAWRYRDYVIRSFNEDKPYHQFIKEQIAGDELNPDDPEMLVAVSYLRMGPWEHTGMSVAAETRQLFLDDITNSVGETFFSIPMQCARCHDHKFDPIPTKDYYRLQANFATVQFASMDASYLSFENIKKFEEGKRRYKKLLNEAEQEIDALNEKEEQLAREWMESRGLKYIGKWERAKLPEGKRPPRFYGLSFQELGYKKVLQKRIQRYKWELTRYEAYAHSVYNGPETKPYHSGRLVKKPENLSKENPKPTFILTGGSVYSPDEKVSPGTISAIQSFLDKAEAIFTDSIPEAMDGRRIALANWIAHPKNPLSTRSIVNRVWQNHFGRGIAENANNFGVMGKKPTHPELLDWLTNEFIQNGWSIKKLHKIIMSSEAYQRASNHEAMDDVKEVDPNNNYLAYFTPRRMTAEEMRDAILMVSGELNLEMGGLPVNPEINEEVAMQPRHIMGTIAPAYQPSPTPEQRNRRSVYTYHYRGLPNPMLEVFNAPNSDLSCERRTESTVTPQVFTLFNSQNSFDRSLAMAVRLEAENPSLEAQIKKGIQLAWNREAKLAEIEKGKAYIEKMVAYHQKHPPESRTYPTKVKRHMFEEMTGEAFEFEEKLEVYENYVPDVKPWDVTPETRALGDFCHVLLNSNEFVYIY
ncbi:PSD1 and planctomycete cytochrome C domain-containing protein [Flexithrix dorotheae]|uniref:PSD1 and planctomycete cytochrome C domain-containing protein n=1 Tax=Flexithrix dorotheae TaxID=70993 RepID=UPI00036FC8D3|nr:PSD1 and planctomycete cytochrome C domain-containing protein [Flexithrix dorotheae]